MGFTAGLINFSLVIGNLFLLLSGVLLIAAGALVMQYHGYSLSLSSVLNDRDFPHGGLLTVVVGVVVLVVGFLGCCGGLTSLDMLGMLCFSLTFYPFKQIKASR